MIIRSLGQTALLFTVLLCTANAASVSIQNDALKLTIDEESGDLTLQKQATNQELVAKGSRALYTIWNTKPVESSDIELSA